MSEETDQLVGIDTELFNKVVEYLMSRPYKEVHFLIAVLQESAQVITGNKPETEEQQTDD